MIYEEDLGVDFFTEFLLLDKNISIEELEWQIEFWTNEASKYYLKYGDKGKHWKGYQYNVQNAEFYKTALCYKKYEVE